MRKLFLFLALAGFLTSGCGKKAPPVASNSGGKPAAIPVAIAPPELGSPGPQADPKQLAREWGEKLRDEDPAVRAEAVHALAELEEEGFGYLFNALQTDKTALRLAVLESISPTLVYSHQKETVPVLIKMLQDKDANVRKRVCISLTWPDKILGDSEVQAGTMAPERLSALRMASFRDSDADVKKVAGKCVQNIQQAIRGKLDQGADKSGPGSTPGQVGARSGDQPTPVREIPR
jgi:hypothetical protein